MTDKGYDSAAFVDAIQRMGAEAVIPFKKNCLHPRTLDQHLYKARSLVERFFLKVEAIPPHSDPIRATSQELSVNAEPGVSWRMAGLTENIL